MRVLFKQMKESERTLQIQREQYKSVFQATSDALLIFDEHNRVVDANASASELLGTSIKSNYRNSFGGYLSRLRYLIQRDPWTGEIGKEVPGYSGY